MASRFILITGATSGVGLAAAKVIASASTEYHVIMTGRSIQKVLQAMSDIQSDGIKGTLSALQLDVTDEASIAAAAKQVRETHGQLHVLVNNAAVGSIDADVKTRFQLCMHTNVIGPAQVAAAFRPLLLETNASYSIWVSSGAGSLTRASAPGAVSVLPNEDAYRASKAALNMIAVREYQDFGSKGLKVFVFCPGFVVSNLRYWDEEAKTGWGKAGDPIVSGQSILSIIEGRRDKDVGQFVHKDGVYPW